MAGGVTVAIECVRKPRAITLSGRVARVALQFGIPLFATSQRVLVVIGA